MAERLLPAALLLLAVSPAFVDCIDINADSIERLSARETIHGVATVLDADTLEVAGETVRLIGIDAPEGEQLCQVDGQAWPCGHVATTAVYEMVGHSPVTCEVYGRDRYGRALSECRLDDRSLNAAIVQAGWALVWYPERGAVLGPRYDDEEAITTSAGSGLWRGAFIPPWEWRRQR